MDAIEMTATPRQNPAQNGDHECYLRTTRKLIALGWVAFQIAVWWNPNIDLIVVRSGHICFAMCLIFANSLRPIFDTRYVSNVVFMALSFVPLLYYYGNIERFQSRISGLDPVTVSDYVVFGVLGILLMEAGRRIAGFAMTSVVMLAVAYQLGGGEIPLPWGHNQDSLSAFVDQQILTLQGLYGVPLGVSVEIVFFFILFAAVFEVFGGGQLIVDLALAATGKYSGGPAKAAVVGSTLTGLVSGSAVANVMSSGIFTIPLMKRVGYRPTFSAGVEAVASTGGQLMPPVMGAAAFIMADLLRIPYVDIVIAAAIPAFLYFSILFLTVDLTARKNRLSNVDPREIQSPLHLLRQRGVLLLPLVWLGFRIVSGFSVTSACMEAIAAVVVIGTIFPATRSSLPKILDGLAQGASRSVSVAIPCALAGIIVGVVSFTGLGTKLTTIIVDLSEGSMMVAVGLTIFGTLLLGFGMPTTSAYIMGAILLAPALVQLGFNELSSHMVIFYFAILSMITPPIALAAYAAAGIAQASPTKTGWEAIRLALPIVLIPIMFLWRPEILTIGAPIDIFWASLTSLVSVTAAAVAIVGWLLHRLNILERSGLIVLSVILFLPKELYNIRIIGIALFIITLVYWLYCERKNRLVIRKKCDV